MGGVQLLLTENKNRLRIIPYYKYTPFLDVDKLKRFRIREDLLMGV